jgi:hypothetical protein
MNLHIICKNIEKISFLVVMQLYQKQHWMKIKYHILMNVQLISVEMKLISLLNLSKLISLICSDEEDVIFCFL